MEWYESGLESSNGDAHDKKTNKLPSIVNNEVIENRTIKEKGRVTMEMLPY